MLFGSVGLGAKVALGAAVVCGGLETNVRIAERNRYRAQRVLSDDPPERPRWRPAWLGPTQLGAVTWAGVAVYLVAFGLR
jgi:hypothetical protein